jgi:hypothetical protein
MRSNNNERWDKLLIVFGGIMDAKMESNIELFLFSPKDDRLYRKEIDTTVFSFEEMVADLDFSHDDPRNRKEKRAPQYPISSAELIARLNNKRNNFQASLFESVRDEGSNSSNRAGRLKCIPEYLPENWFKAGSENRDDDYEEGTYVHNTSSLVLIRLLLLHHMDDC